MAWTNLNASNNNFLAIDLVTQDGTRGVQATFRTTKAKVVKTIDALVKELARPTNRLTALLRVEVVGLTCVNNPTVTSWQTIKGYKHSVRVRGIDLETLLGLPNLGDVELANLDQALQGLATTSPFHLRSDQEEMRTILAYLDRPAIRDRRPVEMDRHAMQDAMLSARRLIAQGANDAGQQITRPFPTFSHCCGPAKGDLHGNRSDLRTPKERAPFAGVDERERLDFARGPSTAHPREGDRARSGGEPSTTSVVRLVRPIGSCPCLGSC